MKTTIKQIAAGTFIALLLMIGNVNASEIKVESLKANETSLQLESWMVSESLWNHSTINRMDYELETETGLEIENWMTSAELWDANTNMSEEFETGLQLEDWMTNDETWNTDNIVLETKLAVEPWMTDSNLWN